MKHTLLLAIFFISCQFSLSQTEKIKATVMSSDFVLEGIEVVNSASKGTTVTNSSGTFSIMAKVGDEITFVSKKYEYKTITLKESDFKQTNWIIKLFPKTEELNEVVISNKITAPTMPSMQELLDRQYMDDAYSTKKNPFGTDGSIAYGPDLIKILGKLGKLFSKGKKSNEMNKMDFKKLAENNLSQDFFSKYLKLNANEIPSFLDFCEADSKSKELLINSNELALMDFLFAKSEEFRKVNK